MRRKTKTVGDRKVIILSGKVTGYDAIKIHKTLEELKKGKNKEVIIDLRKVEYMDSNCLGALMYSQIALNKYGKKIFLSAPQDFLAKLFRDCSYDKVFEIVETYE